MELEALIGAMTMASESEAVILTDSMYAYHTWKGDWKAKENLDLVQRIVSLRKITITVEWKPRNSTSTMQRADYLSKAAASECNSLAAT
jgi:ribonuclease HI